ncbi:hypothetical protein DFJ73DRAFT_962929 [Zopfochytrium polystomum]|nr:hypothetical protein DFJ73DRAFT_962929 [Zopfochytrium polystomum]
MALTLKVSYRGILRSILTANPAVEATTWSAFDARIRKAFAIPAEVPLAVTYVDADGDHIAIDSDEELAELLRLFGGSGKSVRFEVRMVQGDEYVVVGGAGESRLTPVTSFTEQPRTVQETAAQPTPVATSAAGGSGAASALPAASSSATSSSLAWAPSSASSSSSSSASSSSSSQNKGKSADAPAPKPTTAQQNPFEKMFGSLEPHLKALQEEYEKSNMGPILEKIAEEAQTAFTPAFEELLRARHSGPRSWGATGGCHPAFGARCGARSFNPHPFGRHHPSAAAAISDPLPAPSERRWTRITCDGCNSHAFTGTRHRCLECRDYDLCDACFANVEQVHGGLRGAGVSHAERFVTMVHPVDRVEEEAVEALRGMGFEETEEVRDLVRRYGGSVERVVELLVREREMEFDVAV